MSLDQLTHFKDFLADRPEWAFLAVSLTTNVTLFTLYARSQNARIRDAQQWLPIAARLGEMLNKAASKARRNRPALPAGRQEEE